MAEMEFVSLLKSVLRLQAELPRIEAVQLESMVSGSCLRIYGFKQTTP